MAKAAIRDRPKNFFMMFLPVCVDLAQAISRRDGF